MMDPDKTIEDLLEELMLLKQENQILKESYAKEIIEHKQAEEMQKNTVSLLVAIFESVHNGILVSSLQGKVIKINAKFAELWQIPGDTSVSGGSKDIFDIVLEKLSEPHRFKAIISELYKNPIAESIDSINLKDGRVFKSISRPMYHEGNPTGRVWSFLDITERKRVEAALQESEERYRVFINSSDDMVFLKDDQLKYLLVNDPLATFFGAEKSDIIGKSDFELMPEQAAHNCLASDKRALKSYSVVIDEEQIGNKNFSTHKFRVPLSNGKWGIGGTIRDVTERRNTERKLIKQSEELRALNATKDKFFSIVSHDLRSPFQALLGFTQILAEELPTLSLEEIQKIAVSMRKSANNLFHLLENLLAWSQNQRGFIQFNPKPILLSDRIEAATKLVKDIADKKAISLNYNIPQGLSALADVQMFESIISNLVMNAVKFTPKGGKVIIIAKNISDNSVEISVKDTGIGMNKYQINSLFKLDERTNRKGTEGESSTGLGLIICKEFLEKHKEKLHVESEEGIGSTFYFKLQAKKKD